MTVELNEEENLEKHEKYELLEKYQYLVEKIINNFNDTSEPHENLKEVGYVGLLNAINLYDGNIHKIDFENYAQILITNEIYQYLSRYNRKIDRPNWLIKLNHKIDQFVINYYHTYQKFPQIAEIAEHLNISNSGLYEILKAREPLDEKNFKYNSEINLFEIQPELQKIRNKSYQSFKLPIEDIITLKKAFSKLKKIQENIIYFIFVMDLNQTKVARELGISLQRIDHLKKEAFSNLQALL